VNTLKPKYFRTLIFSYAQFVFESPHLQDNVLNIIENSENSVHVDDTRCVISGYPCSGIEPMDEILFAKNLGVVTDMKFGPDGALYVISLMEGKIYRIAN